MRLIDKDKTMEEIPIDVCDGFEVTDIIEKMPTVQAIPIPEGATNGDMMKIMFTHMDYQERNNVTLNIKGQTIEFTGMALKEWWNAPYKKESEN